MSGYTDSALERKLAGLDESQESIMMVSSWILHHKKYYKYIIDTWMKELRKAEPNRKLIFMYVANHVIQMSEQKGPEFSRSFAFVLDKAFRLVSNSTAGEKTRNSLHRIINIWSDRGIYDQQKIHRFRTVVEHKSANGNTTSIQMKDSHRSSLNSNTEERAEAPYVSSDSETVTTSSDDSLFEDLSPDLAKELIRTMEDLENCPSKDKNLKEIISIFPQFLSVISQQSDIKDSNARQKVVRAVDTASELVSDYRKRLSEELEKRKLLSKLFADLIRVQEEESALVKKKIQDLKDRLERVNDIRSELRRHISYLPKAEHLYPPDLAPLPSAKELFF